MGAPKYFKFYPNDFLVGTADMSAEEVGAYARLLCYQWEKDGLDNDPIRLATLTGCQCSAIARVLDKFMLCDDMKLRNERLEKERGRLVKISQNQHDKAIKRWRNPTSPEAIRIAHLYHRKLTTEWHPKEILAFKQLKKDGHFEPPLDTLELVCRYVEYQRTLGDQGRHRRDMGTFLNNYGGEVDRAREWAAKNPKKAAAHKNGAEPEPEGWREWLDRTYPKAAQASYATVPESVRVEFRNTKRP